MHCIYLTLSRFSCRFTIATGLRAAFEFGSAFFFWGDLNIEQMINLADGNLVVLHLQHVQI